MRAVVFLISIFLALTACGPIDRPTSRIRVEPEPAGAHCPVGGQVISVGIDDNDNGNLDEEEVEERAYICNGEQGERGEDGRDGEDGQNGEKPRHAVSIDDHGQTG